MSQDNFTGDSIIWPLAERYLGVALILPGATEFYLILVLSPWQKITAL